MTNRLQELEAQGIDTRMLGRVSLTAYIEGYKRALADEEARYAPVLKAVFQQLTALFEMIQKDDSIKKLGGSFKEIASSGVVVIAFLGSFGGEVSKVIRGAVGAFSAFGKVLPLIFSVALAEIKAGVLGLVKTFKETFTKLDKPLADLAKKLGITRETVFQETVEDEQLIQRARNASAAMRKEFGNALGDIEADIGKLGASFKDTDSGVAGFLEVLTRMKAAIDEADASVLKFTTSIGTGGEEGTGLAGSFGSLAAASALVGETIGEMPDFFGEAAESAEAFAAIVGQAGAASIAAIAASSSSMKDRLKGVINALAAAAGAATARWVLETVPPPGSFALAPIAGAAATALVSQLGSFHEGGVVSRSDLLTLPGMRQGEGIAMLEEGETVTPANASGPGGMQVSFNSMLPITESEARRIMDRQLTRRLQILTENGF